MINKTLIKQAVLAMRANQRQTTSHVKTRGEVPGGGRKPWKQKGPGRARAGSSRSPIWSGGGVVFGPSKDRNYTQTLPKKMAQKAKSQLWQMLKLQDRIISVPKLALAEPKTKLAVKLLLDVKPKGKTLLVTEVLQPELILATANLEKVEVKTIDQVSLLDLASYQTLVLEEGCFKRIYGEAKPVKKTAKSKIGRETKRISTE